MMEANGFRPKVKMKLSHHLKYLYPPGKTQRVQSYHTICEQITLNAGTTFETKQRLRLCPVERKWRLPFLIKEEATIGALSSANSVDSSFTIEEGPTKTKNWNPNDIPRRLVKMKFKVFWDETNSIDLENSEGDLVGNKKLSTTARPTECR